LPCTPAADCDGRVLTFAKNTVQPARLASTWAPLPLYGFSRMLGSANDSPSSTAATCTWPTKTRHRSATPAAAEVPTLVRGLRPLGHVARRCYPPLRCGMPGLPARASFAVKGRAFGRFPPTNAEARGIRPQRRFAVWHRLPRDSLASPPLPVRLGLSWLSCSRPSFRPVPVVVHDGTACRQARSSPRQRR
jgi:hypothetical protein